MKSRKSGARHPLLIYRHFMDRMRTTALLLGLLLAGVWSLDYLGILTAWLPPESGSWLIGTAAIMLAAALFALLGRSMAYAQARADHFRLVTPFLRLKISYRRVRSLHPADLKHLFPPHKSGGAQHPDLSPFYGMTAVVVELNGFPLSPALLRLFLSPLMFHRQTPGLVLLVPDWIKFSTELDTFRGTWQHSRRS